jgi:mono/diheme cytochrome c family protein
MLQGQLLYRQYCQRCHDENGSGARTRARAPEIPDFTDELWQEKRSDAQLAASILDGKGTSMPAFGGQLSKDTARILAAYVRSLDPPSPGHVKPAESDFERRFRQLELEMEELQRQFDALTPPSQH